MKTRVFASALLAAAASMPAAADIMQIEISGSVEFNLFASGPLAGVPAGAPASLRFQVDSNNFVNSPSFPTRGYVIAQPTFLFQAGNGQATLQNPFPPGQTPYFVLRNNDPAVDGFFIGTGVDLPHGVPLNFNPNARMNYLSTFQSGSVLQSLDILSAVGTYTLAQMSVFDWRISVGPGDPMGMIFDRITISVVPAPSAAFLIGTALLLGRPRRRGFASASTASVYNARGLYAP
jgi:hypothetical protein